MPFLSLTINNFRNLADASIDLNAKEIYFVGENGQGKSNLLEALYYAAYGASWRTHSDSQIVKNGAGGASGAIGDCHSERSEESYSQGDVSRFRAQHDTEWQAAQHCANGANKANYFSISALYQQESGSVQKINVRYELADKASAASASAAKSSANKRIEKNGKKIQDRKELINTIPCVLFCHDDLRFATGEPEWRRFFLDQSLTMFNPLYIDDLRNYKKIVKNRNAILKAHNYEMLDVYDRQLAESGLEIQKKRKNAVFQFNQIFGKLYEDISDIRGVSILYEPSWKEPRDEIAPRVPTVDDITAHLLKTRDRDKFLETSMSGPHRDKITFVRGGGQFIPSASTGQQRLVALLLRVAQAVYYNRITNVKPVFLMDDVMLELDVKKRQRLNALLPEYDQLFCTFLPNEPYERYRRTTTKVFMIEDGNWHE